MLSDIEISFGFEDIAIKQKKNKCKSRLDVNINSEIIQGVIRSVPLIASNMSTVINADFCIELNRLGSLGVMHRAAPEEVIIEEVRKIASKCPWTAASIGVGDSQVELAEKLINVGCNIIFIDIAHGYCDAVIETGRRIKKTWPKVKVVVGNTINIDMLEEVADFADGVKVGIAGGRGCETKNMTGCYMPMFSAVYQFKERASQLGIPIISDGSIKEPSDFVKAIAAGANCVMAGSIFARCPESAAEIVETETGRQKVYAGMASRYVQDKWRGGLKPNTCTEGKVVLLNLGESAEKLLERYAGGLRSGITYAGENNIRDFQSNVEFIRLK